MTAAPPGVCHHDPLDTCPRCVPQRYLAARGDRLHVRDLEAELAQALRERDELREQANLFAALIEEYRAKNAALRVRAETAEADLKAAYEGWLSGKPAPDWLLAAHAAAVEARKGS